MSLAEKVSQMSHIELEKLARAIDLELGRRWKNYEENPEEFRAVISDWSGERLENFIFVAEMEMEYAKKASPPKTLEVAKQEMERREQQQKE